MDNSSDKGIKYILEATKIYGDNAATLTVGNSDFVSRRSRSINVKFHLVKDAVKEGKMELQFVKTYLNKADFFTKCLGYTSFKHWRDYYMF